MIGTQSRTWFTEQLLTHVGLVVCVLVVALHMWGALTGSELDDESLFFASAWRMAYSSSWLSEFQKFGAVNYPLHLLWQVVAVKVFGAAFGIHRLFAFLFTVGGMVLLAVGANRLKILKGWRQTLFFLLMGFLSASVFSAATRTRPECLTILICGLLAFSYSLQKWRGICVAACSFLLPWCGPNIAFAVGLLIGVAWLFFRFPVRWVLIPACAMMCSMIIFVMSYRCLGLLDGYFEFTQFNSRQFPSCLVNPMFYLAHPQFCVTLFCGALLPLPFCLGLLQRQTGFCRKEVCCGLTGAVTSFIALMCCGGSGLVCLYYLFVPWLALAVSLAICVPVTTKRVPHSQKYVMGAILFGAVLLSGGYFGRFVNRFYMAPSRIAEDTYLAWCEAMVRKEDVVLSNLPVHGLLPIAKKVTYDHVNLQALKSSARRDQTEDTVILRADNSVEASLDIEGTWQEQMPPLIGTVPRWGAKTKERIVYHAYRRIEETR